MILDKNGNAITSEKSAAMNFNYDYNFMSMAHEIAGVKVSQHTAITHGHVYACIKVLAESIGQLPVRLYQNTSDKRVLVKKHSMLNVLTKMPNDYMTWQEMLEMIVTHLNLDGNFYAYINATKGTKNKRRIVEIIPIPAPNSVSIKMTNGKLSYHVAPDSVIKLPKSDFAASEILHIKGTTLDGIKGMSPITHAASSIGLSIASELHGESFFKNNATPNGILSTDQPLSDAAFERLQQNFNAIHQGVKNSNKLAILEEGLKFQNVTISHKDSQFLETRNFQKSEICSIFRVPAQLVGADSNVTYSNVEQAMMSFHRDTLIPLITRIVSRINGALPDDLEIDLDDRHLLRGDQKTQADVAKIYFDMGSYTINEVRQMRGDAPIEGGDVIAVATNNYTLGTLEHILERQEQLLNSGNTDSSKPDEPQETPAKEDTN